MKKVIITLLLLIIFGKAWAQTFDEVLEKAKAGNAEAQYQVSELYSEQKEEKSAFKWAQRASKLGHAQAQLKLGIMYYEQEDYNKAHHWVSEAMKQGLPKARIILSLMFPQYGHVPKYKDKKRRRIE